MYRYIVTRVAAGLKRSEEVEAGSVYEAATKLARGEITKAGDNADRSLVPTYVYEEVGTEAYIYVQSAVPLVSK